MSRDIQELRSEIDQIDKQIVSLLKQRLETANEVAEYKRERDLPVLDSRREQALMERISEQSGEYATYVRSIYHALLSNSRSFQNVQFFKMNRAVDASQKFRRKGLPKHLSHFRFLPCRTEAQTFAPDLAAGVGGHYHNGIFKADPPARGVREAPLLHDLQKDSQNVRMGLFQFIQQHQTVGSSAHRFRQFAPFFVAHISRRRANQPGYRLLFHKFRHIQPDHRLPAAINLLGQYPAKLRFPHPCGACKHQAGNGPFSVPDAGKSSSYRLRRRFHRLRLSDDLTCQHLLQIQQPLPLAAGKPAEGNSRPQRYHRRDIPRGNRSSPAVFRPPGGNPLHSVPKPGRLFEIAFPDRVLKLLLQLLPTGIAGPAPQFFHSHPGGPFIHQVNGLIRQIQVRQIPDRQPDSLLQGILGNPKPVMLLQPRLQRS